ncbi:MAG: hypothetical protein ABI640_18885 [Gammaproteobacteria bacterium]
MPTDTLRREIIIGAVCFALGFFILPLAIYWVGHELIGNYSPDASAGALALAESIWADVLHFRLAAWVLVLAPYALVLLLRFTRSLWRAAPL